MKLHPLLLHVSVLLGCALISAYAAAATSCSPFPCPSQQRQRELVDLVRKDCGSCHGLSLQGGLGPSLLPPTIAFKPEEALLDTVVNGRAGTPMPAWAPFLSEDEAKWVVRALMEGFPELEAKP